MTNWFIAADDLTGAADCAVAFRRYGLNATVGWGNSTPPLDDNPCIFSYNADSRELNPQASKQIHRQLLEKFWRKDDFLFQKIDSTLRGQPAANIAETIAFLKQKLGRGIGILAPAFPAMGRTTIGGKIMINGIELEKTELWQRDHTYPTSDLKMIIEDFAKVPCCVIGTELLHENFEKTAHLVSQLENKYDGGVLIFDAQTQDDLLNIAHFFPHFNPARFFIGSAGLAHAFATLSNQGAKKDYPILKHDGGIMIVVGSLAHVSRSAVKKLAEMRNGNHYVISPNILLAKGKQLEDYRAKITNTLKQGGNCFIEIALSDDLNLSLGSTLATNLAQALKCSAPYLAGFAATGGETASAFLDAFGVNGIYLHGELETGISLGVTKGDVEIPVITKAGAFGNEMSLVHIFDILTQIKTEGKLR